MTFNSLVFLTGSSSPENNVSALDNQFYFQADKATSTYAFWIKTSSNGLISNVGWKKIG